VSALARRAARMQIAGCTAAGMSFAGWAQAGVSRATSSRLRELSALPCAAADHFDARPPLLTTGKPVAGPGVRASLLRTTKRKDGTLEVTYGGHPLYSFVTDRKPGDTTGQGLNQFGSPWWVLSAAGKEVHHHG
jgi:Secreted repeat of unknown function